MASVHIAQKDPFDYSKSKKAILLLFLNMMLTGEKFTFIRMYNSALNSLI